MYDIFSKMIPFKHMSLMLIFLRFSADFLEYNSASSKGDVYCYVKLMLMQLSSYEHLDILQVVAFWYQVSLVCHRMRK